MKDKTPLSTRKTGVSYLCIGYAISLLFSEISGLQYSISGMEELEAGIFSEWIEYVKGFRLNDIAFPGGLLIPGACMLLYVLPLLRGKRTGLTDRRILNAPIAAAIFIFLGWLFNFTIRYGIALSAHLSGERNFLAVLLIFPLSTVITALPPITLTYLALEVFNRVSVLPRLFPDGGIFSVRGAVKPSLSLLFVMVFCAVCLHPVFEITSYLILLDYHRTQIVSFRPLLQILMPILLAALIMAILLRLIRKPLKLLSAAVGRVELGDYTQGVRHVSNDETGILADGFNKMTASLAEKEFLRDTFGKVVDPRVRDYLTKGAVSLRGESREVTVLFCDIRSFTAMSEKLTAEEVVQFLNGYFSALGACITRNNGIINKYIGDAIMAMFGAPVPSANHAEDAFRAAVEMRSALAQLNRQYEAEGRPPVRFGIGLHTGMVFAGTIGSRERMEYTIIGDTVNTASRIESLCKDYGTDILVSESTVSKLTSSKLTSRQPRPEAGGKPDSTADEKLHLETDARLTFVDDAHIRGKEQAIKVYAVGG